jgi:cell division protein FtsQ
MKPWLKNILWVCLLATVWIVMGFVETEQENRVVGIPEVEIDLFEDMIFLTEEDVIQRLLDKHLIGEDKVYTDLNLEKIEAVLVDMPEIKTAQTYTYLSGMWKIDIKLRQPIARIFNIDGTSCYLDKDGTLMPLSPNYTAHVVTVDGNINETDFTKTVDDIINNDSLITLEILDDLYEISNYVCSDAFLSAQFTHIHINGYDEFELIPRVGDQRVMFGDAEYVAGKFKKLEYFYTEGISRTGWENYDTINVMYKSQVVCSHRD